MDITAMDEKELKALAYDEILRKDQAQQNLQIIAQELRKRSLEANKPSIPAPQVEKNDENK